MYTCVSQYSESWNLRTVSLVNMHQLVTKQELKILTVLMVQWLSILLTSSHSLKIAHFVFDLNKKTTDYTHIKYNEKGLHIVEIQC